MGFYTTQRNFLSLLNSKILFSFFLIFFSGVVQLYLARDKLSVLMVAISFLNSPGWLAQAIGFSVERSEIRAVDISFGSLWFRFDEICIGNIHFIPCSMANFPRRGITSTAPVGRRRWMFEYASDIVPIDRL